MAAVVIVSPLQVSEAPSQRVQGSPLLSSGGGPTDLNV
jgi:hypothetical protein